LSVAAASGPHEYRLVIVVCRIAVGPVLDQYLDCAEVAVSCCCHQGGAELVAVGLIDGGPALEQESKYFGMAERGRTVQRRGSCVSPARR
jgi:hypothetical protein